ncbi:hypothetical protein, partial [Pseudomonas syringae]|uniref:hypothetical protein n=1 Tax=Pseudomonas syringae TaxID=317 RepID=UPI0024E0C502
RGTLFRLWRRVASWGLAPEKNLEHSIKLQLSAGNVGFMGRLLNTAYSKANIGALTNTLRE